MIILDGIVLNREFLSDYFYREFKKAENEHIGWNEFYKNIKKIIAQLRIETERPYYEEISLWNKYIVQQREKGDNTDFPMPQKYDSGISLFLLTPKYSGHLYGSDLDYIDLSLNESLEKLLREKKLYPLFYYAFERSILPSETTEIEPLKLQRIFELSQNINDLTFTKNLKNLEANKISEFLDFHSRSYLRNEGSLIDWIEHTIRLKPSEFTPLQEDAFFTWIENNKPLITEENKTETRKSDNQITDLLHCLSGSWRNCKIMTDAEYSRLLEYVTYIFDYGKLPLKIIPISKGFSGLPKLFYQHTIYRLWLEHGKKHNHKQELWVSFIKKIFKDHYKNTNHNLSKSFSRYNTGRDGYELDKKLITF